LKGDKIAIPYAQTNVDYGNHQVEVANTRRPYTSYAQADDDKAVKATWKVRGEKQWNAWAADQNTYGNDGVAFAN
jgi:hypothetical protein